jgi:hypothetical protein
MLNAAIECVDTGVCISDHDQLMFKSVRRPIYPLDLINDPISCTEHA